MSDDIKNKLDDIKIAGNNLKNSFKLRKDKLDKFYKDESTGQLNNSNLKGLANNERNSSIIITRMKRKNNENNEDSIAKKLKKTVAFNVPLTDN